MTVVFKTFVFVLALLADVFAGVAHTDVAISIGWNSYGAGKNARGDTVNFGCVHHDICVRVGETRVCDDAWPCPRLSKLSIQQEGALEIGVHIVAEAPRDPWWGRNGARSFLTDRECHGRLKGTMLSGDDLDARASSMYPRAHAETNVGPTGYCE